MCTFEHFNISYCVVHGSKFAQRDCIVSLSLATRDRRVRVELCRAREAPPFVSRLESRGRYVRPGVSVPAALLRTRSTYFAIACPDRLRARYVGIPRRLPPCPGPGARRTVCAACAVLSSVALHRALAHPSHSRRPPAHHAPERALGASQTDALAFRSPSATALSPSTHVNFVCFESAMSARICHQGPFDAIEGQLGGSSGAMRSNQVPH